LRRAFAESFASGSKHVVIIGSDCPFVTIRDVEHAWNGLRSCDLVIGPATDGGYWLIGLRRSQPELFRNIAWSTEKVLAQTRARAESRGLRVRLLREQTDIDTFAEWEAFCRRR
jgi:rSAM/selenodomain-associated transferase 1